MYEVFLFGTSIASDRPKLQKLCCSVFSLPPLPSAVGRLRLTICLHKYLANKCLHNPCKRVHNSHFSRTYFDPLCNYRDGLLAVVLGGYLKGSEFGLNRHQ